MPADTATDPTTADVTATNGDGFVERLERVIDAGLGNPDIGVDAIARAVAMDRSTLYRYLCDRSLPPPSQWLRTRRLHHAAGLLRNGAGVAEAAYAVGFRSVSHFSKAFQTEFGTSPSRHCSSQ